jgi:hypothetical protein
LRNNALVLNFTSNPLSICPVKAMKVVSNIRNVLVALFDQEGSLFYLAEWSTSITTGIFCKIRKSKFTTVLTITRASEGGTHLNVIFKLPPSLQMNTVFFDR